MSRTGRSARLPSSRPRTAVTPKRLNTGGGDNALSLDEELQTVLRKEYEDGESGKKEAIQDVKTVLKQVSQEPIAVVMDKLIPRFLTPISPQSGNSSETTSKSGGSRSKHTPRHGKLTARPSARQKSSRQTTDETSSLRHIPKRTSLTDAHMRLTTSAPTLPATSMHTSYPDTSSDMQETPERIGVESGVMTSGSTAGSFTEDGGATTILPPDATMTGEEESEEEELPYTENLLEIPSDTEDGEDIWKSDIVELTKMKSAPRGKVCGSDVLELKYKEPLWPHQLLLHQILARLPKLTHLILDGSELRFLRDLGSSLMSLITLSICDCALRSLDGAYAFPNLRTLIARKNMIRIPTQCSFLTRLSYLDLSSNPISNADEFGALRLCGELRILKLHDTPLATTCPNFNKELKRLVPQLKEIHPPRVDVLQLKQIRKQGQQQMREESKQVENKEESSVPSMAYNDVMVDEPKAGIAYQKVSSNKTKQQLNQQTEIEDVSLGTGDFTGVYMAPKFLQHLDAAMPPSTAEEEEQLNGSVASNAANYYQDEIYDGGDKTRESLGGSGSIQRKKSDGAVQPSGSNKNHPAGDGESWYD